MLKSFKLITRLDQDWPIWPYVVSKYVYPNAWNTEKTSGTPYILVIIALLTEMSNIKKRMPVDSMSSLGLHLKQLPGKW